jgi:hypothetical protein
MSRIETAIEAYNRTFKQAPPLPFGVHEDNLADALEQALAKGEPIPDDFDWYADLPPDAVA